MTPVSRDTFGDRLPPNFTARSEAPSRYHRLYLWAFRQAQVKGRANGYLRTAVRILLIMHAEFFRTHITMRASALTFSIILSLVPMLALSTSILKGLGSDDRLRQAAIRFIDQLEPRSSAPSAADTASPTSSSAAPPPETTPPRSRNSSLTAHLHQAVEVIFAYVNRTNFAALGLIGVIGLILVVLLVLASIEDAMNAIWHTSRGRSLLRKLMDYLALLILLPISINIALAAEAALASKRIMERIVLIVPTAWVVALLIKVVPFLAVVLTLMFLYLFFPHVRVRTGPALAGAVFAAVCWFWVQKIYITLQVGVANYNAIYGSFATVPLFLVWLLIGWTFILLGALFAYAIQHHDRYDFPGLPPTPQRRLQACFDILQQVYCDFVERTPTTLNRLREQLGPFHQTEVDAVVKLLIDGNLLAYRGENGEDLLLPVTPADHLASREIVALILGNETLPGRSGELATYAVTGAARAVADIPVYSPPQPQERHEQGIAPDHL